MRIISGKLKGKHFHPGKGFRDRPTTDFAREALFNILHNYFDIESITVLDLFSGTGGISFEFASRGCPSVELVEINSRYLSMIERNISGFEFDQISPYSGDAFAFIRNTPSSYDIIFADPPHSMEGVDKIPELVFERGILKTGGWLVLEHDKRHEFSEHPFFRETRRYGNVLFTIFEKD